MLAEVRAAEILRKNVKRLMDARGIGPVALSLGVGHKRNWASNFLKADPSEAGDGSSEVKVRGTTLATLDPLATFFEVRVCELLDEHLQDATQHDEPSRGTSPVIGGVQDAAGAVQPQSQPQPSPLSAEEIAVLEHPLVLIARAAVKKTPTIADKLTDDLLDAWNARRGLHSGGGSTTQGGL